MFQRVSQEDVTRLLIEKKGYSPRRSFGDGKSGRPGDQKNKEV
jgi:hypothetical protein